MTARRALAASFQVHEEGFEHQAPMPDVPPPDDLPDSAEQMRAMLLSSYIAYSGPCVVDEGAGSVTLKVDAAWRPDYVGTEQKRFFRFDNGRLIFGPAPNSMRSNGESLTRRLTLERAQP